MRDNTIEIDLQLTLADKFVECINSVPAEIDLLYNYITVPTTNGTKNLKIDAVFADGYESEGVFYPFGIFKPLDPVDYEPMAKNEKEVLKRIEEQKKGLS